ncbi:MAG: hypothetical protein ACLGSD_10235 [Acidobacteriota bacterium]
MQKLIRDPESLGRSPGEKGGLRHWLRHTLGVDKAIAFTVMGRGWASFAGLLTIVLIAHFLSPAEQGYYYTFGSLIALQIVFELGFSFVILQLASHERAHLTIGLDESISGNPVAHDRLASVLQKTVRWYTIAAALLAIALVIAGSYFFSVHNRGAAAVHWRIPWYADALAATLTFQLDPILSFMEGCGFVARVARVRMIQAVTGSTLAWIALVSHHGLFAPAMIIAGNACVSLIWLFRRRRLLVPLLRHHSGPNKIHWLSEVWPFQWRIAASWLCGYFIYQLYNPVLFAFRGAVAAGQMGMAISLSNALLSVAVSWINTKAAPFGTMIARKQYDQLDHLFFQALKQSLGVCAAGALVLWLSVVYLNWAHLSFARRVLDPTSLGILLIASTLNITVNAEAVYLRAHKQEKFLIPSMVGALFIGSSTYFLGKYYGAFGMVSGNLAVTIFVGLPLGNYVFFKYRRLWHAR